jgi:hypothetical protein
MWSKLRQTYRTLLGQKEAEPTVEEMAQVLEMQPQEGEDLLRVYRPHLLWAEEHDRSRRSARLWGYSNKEEKLMLVGVSPSMPEKLEAPVRHTLVTTLYDLIEAIQETLEPEEDTMVTPIVMHLLQCGRVSFHGNLEEWADHTIVGERRGSKPAEEGGSK